MTAPLTGGFADPPLAAARAFRAALEALSRPGRIVEVTGAAPPAPLSVAAGVLLLTLTDRTTPVHLAGPHDAAGVRDWLAFHTGAPLVRDDEAAFAVGTWDALQPLDRFPVGLPAYPDRSATLIVEVPSLRAEGAALRGPGIAGTARLNLPDSAVFRANRALFPLGLDLFLTCGNQIAGLPRTTIVGDA